MRKIFLWIPLIILFSVPVIIPLFHSEFFQSDDGEWMIIRFSAFHQALADGQFPVRFLGRLNYGYGYPVADFLYPGFMYFGEIFKFLGFGFVSTIKIILGLSMIGSALFIFLWLSKIFSRWASFVGSLLYLYVPYHLFDLYKRGSVGEILALGIIPFIFWQIERRSFFWTSVGIGFLILSHNTLALLFLPIIVIYLLTHSLASAVYFLPSIFLGLGLSAFFWIPAIFDLQYTVFDKTKVSDFSDHFASLDLVGLSLLTVFVIVLLTFRRFDNSNYRTKMLMIFTGVAAVFLSLPISSFAWQLLPSSFVQFPFRFLSITILSAAFLGALLIDKIKGKKSFAIGVLFLILGFISSFPYLSPAVFFDKGDSYYSTNEGTTTVKNEYMSVWVRDVPKEHFKEKVEIANGEIKDLVVKTNNISFLTDSKTNTTVTINTIYFPGWMAKVDGKNVPINYQNNKAIMQLNIPSGEHRIEINFSETPIRLASDIVSLVFLFVLLVIAIVGKLGKMSFLSIVKKNYAMVLILILSFWAIKPLLIPGFFPIHDNEQVARLFDLDQALKAGQIPPRIAPNLGFGYGYPFFNFYPPLAYYIAELFKLMGFSYIWSIKIMVGAGFAMGSIFMYLLSKEFFGKLGGVISAVFYTYAPYHAVDVYVRGAFPEFWSMVFLPAVFWSLYRLKGSYRLLYLILSVFFMSMLILTHNLVMVMAIPFILLWIIFLTFVSKNKKIFLFYSLFVLILPFLVTSYFWVPSFFEKQYTMINLLTAELANYGQHFVYFRQFWNSAWGYGGSIYGLNDGLSFEVGKLHLSLSFLAFVMGVRMVFVKKTRMIGVVVFVLFISLLFSIFMASFHSKFIWDRIEFLWYMQFPWRYLIFSAFFSSFLAGFVGLVIAERRIKFLAVFVLVAVVIVLNMNYFVPAKFYRSVEDSDYTSEDKIRWDASIIAWEYVPKGIATKKSDINTTLIDINKEDIARKSFEVLSGDMTVKPIKDLPQEKIFLTSSDKKSVLRINTYSFPGWKIYIDGKEVSYTDNNKFKLITLKPLVGSHTVVAKFTDTSIRFWSNWVSLISISALIIFYLSHTIRSWSVRYKPAI